MAKTINGLFKAEAIHRRRPWRSIEAVEYATPEWVDWFNNRRLLKPIGNIPPAEPEANFYATLERSDMAAQPRQITPQQTRRGSKRSEQRIKTVLDVARSKGFRGCASRVKVACNGL